MTREEAIKLLKQYQGYEPMFPDGEKLKHAFDLTDETVDTLLAALRGPTREMVERMRGEWIPAESDFDDDDTLFDVDDWCDWKCSACHSEICYDDPMERRWLPKFCPNCGAPMTDEAVDMMLERWKEAVDSE